MLFSPAIAEGNSAKVTTAGYLSLLFMMSSGMSKMIREGSLFDQRIKNASFRVLYPRIHKIFSRYFIDWNEGDPIKAKMYTSPRFVERMDFYSYLTYSLFLFSFIPLTLLGKLGIISITMFALIICLLFACVILMGSINSYAFRYGRLPNSIAINRPLRALLNMYRIFILGQGVKQDDQNLSVSQDYLFIKTSRLFDVDACKSIVLHMSENDTTMFADRRIVDSIKNYCWIHDVKIQVHTVSQNMVPDSLRDLSDIHLVLSSQNQMFIEHQDALYTLSWDPHRLTDNPTEQQEGVIWRLLESKPKNSVKAVA